MSKHSRDELVWQFIDALRASQTATEMADAAVAERLGLHQTDARCLDILDREGPMTAGQLAERARLSPGAMTSLLDRIERKGLARRTRDTQDRRRVLVAVTPLLRELAERLYGPPEQAAKGLAHYSDEQLELLTAFHRESVAYQEALIRKLETLEVPELTAVDDRGSAP